MTDDVTPTIEVPIAKVDEDRRLFFGFAKMATVEDGRLLIDKQQDMVTPEELEETAYDFVLHSREAGEMHVKGGSGRLVESMVFTPEKLEKLGVPEGAVPSGWWVGFKVDDDEAWEGVKSGRYKMLSIEGRAQRIPVTVTADQAVEE